MAAINARDYSQVEELTAPDVQLRFPPAQVFYGRDGVREFLAELEKRMQDIVMLCRRMYTGDGFAVVEWDAAGRSAARSLVDDMGVMVLQTRDGLVERSHIYLDTALWQQLGSEAG